MGLADPLKTVILAMLRDMTQGKGGGDLQLSYVEHAFNANLLYQLRFWSRTSQLLLVPLVVSD